MAKELVTDQISESPGEQMTLLDHRWCPVSSEAPIAIRPLGGGQYELAVYLLRPPTFYNVTQAVFAKNRDALSKAVAAVIAASADPLFSGNDEQSESRLAGAHQRNPAGEDASAAEVDDCLNRQAIHGQRNSIVRRRGNRAGAFVRSGFCFFSRA